MGSVEATAATGVVLFFEKVAVHLFLVLVISANFNDLMVVMTN